jgi:signal transduction histidine kinase
MSVLAHDLRNPLGAIIMSAETSLRSGADALPAELRRRLDRIVQSARRMERLVRDVTDLARARLGGALPIRRSSASLSELSRTVLDELRALHPQRRLELHAEGPADGCFDVDRLVQAIGNLLANALEHGAPDQPVVVSIRGEDGTVLLEVQNWGPPIPADVRERIFEPYVRGGAKGGGLGLGLYIVREIARAHGGSVEVGSSLARGTTFTLRLPRRGPGDVR